MKVKQENIEYILGIIKTAKLVNIKNIIVEPGMVRAVDDSSTVFLLQNENVPDMEFGSVGLTRTDVLVARYDIVSNQEGFNITAAVDDDDMYARSLILSSNNTKVDYRCSNPTKLKAPRQLNDTMKHEVFIDKEATELLQRGTVAMGSETVSIISNKDVSFELVDVNNDVFKHTFADSVTSLTEDTDTTFVYRYPVKTLLALFKQYPENKIQIGSKGILRMPIDNLNVYVLPQV